jgi:hypothetical protein
MLLGMMEGVDISSMLFPFSPVSLCLHNLSVSSFFPSHLLSRPLSLFSRQQLGTHKRGKAKREEMTNVIQAQRKAAAASKQ